MIVATPPVLKMYFPDGFTDRAHKLIVFLLPYADFGPKRITVNAIAPGGVKTDMYIESARKYIPGGESLSDEQLDAVSKSLCPCPKLAFRRR